MKNNLIRTICINLFTLVFIAGIFNHSYSQIDGLKNVGTINLNGFGNIVKDQELTGYYFFYSIDPEKPLQDKYVLSILDLNFKQVSIAQVHLSSFAYLTEVVYSGEGYMLKFLNNTNGQEVTIFLNDSGKQIKEVKRKLSLFEGSNKYLVLMQMVDNAPFNSVHSLGKSGFIENFDGRKGNKGYYEIIRYDNAGNQKWKHLMEDDSKLSVGSGFLALGKSEVYSLVYKRKNGFSDYATIYLIANDLTSGAKLFEVPVSNSSYQLSPGDAYVDEATNEIVVTGTYYPLAEKSLDGKSSGFFTFKVGRDGVFKEQKLYSWADVAKLAVLGKEKLSDVGSLAFHKVYKGSDGKIYIVAEEYTKGGNMAGLPSRNDATGGTASIGELMVFMLGSDYKLESARIYAKQNTKVTLSATSDNMGIQMYANVLKGLGCLDVSFVSVSKDQSNAIIGYRKFDPATANNKFDFNYTVIDKGNFTTGNISLDKRRTGFFRLMPSRSGQAAIFEYLKKEMFLDLRTIKLK